ncbi:hypothetical protein Hdeb2414_s0011g00368401 [Helianthus debilis subsp. tardiflorus]
MMKNRAGDKKYTRTHTWHQSACVDHCPMISTQLLMTDLTIRTTVRTRGSIQHAPTTLSLGITNGRGIVSRMNIPCC